MIPEFEQVVLLVDLPEHKLKAGDMGVVVHVAENRGYLVEFMNAKGDTIAVAQVWADDVRSLTDNDMQHVRDLAA